MVMEKIKRGFKQTELGVIPDDWEIKRIDELFKFLRTANNTRSDLSENFGDMQYIHYGDIHTKWHFFLDCSKNSIPLIKGDKVKGVPNLEDGDLVIVDASEDYEGIGTGVEIKNIDHKKIVAGLHTILLRGDKTKLVDGYKGYVLSIKTVKDALIKITTGISVYSISKNNLKQVQIPFPKKLEEQSAIAKVLSDTDALIESLDSLITKKKNIKQGAMQELLTGKKRLLGFKERWEHKRLGEISKIKTGKKNNEDKVETGEYPFFVRSQNVERINSYSFDGEAILVPGEGGIGSIFHYVNGKFDYHQRVYKISDFDKGVSGKFVYYYMLQNFNKHAMENSVKATVDSLRLPTFNAFELILPPSKDEQSMIVKVLSDMDAEIEELEQKRDKYKLLKIGLMQELLTGRIRLKWQN